MELRTFAFDLDGVIAKYNGVFEEDGKIDEPCLEVVEAIKILKNQGHKILVYSTRSTKALKDYCEKYKIPVDYYNDNPEYKTGNPGKPMAFVYVDDRVILYKGQSAEKLVDELNNFKPYWR